ncbi:heat-shock protein [Myriangium duriaei CBS 260.36]|uniref:Heat-shock protein n=1 Tax=Myriangium duriaei CBS 260.36 TaxID=1168546 RepID=A0A9P4MJ83_9PEZI|nr:heat-shock protein [Myriangium duriaei CBS 260.36]
MSLFPRFAAGEFSPLFRLLDDYASHQFSRGSLPSFPATTLRSFQPRFDVKENKDAYQLEGELPGVEQQNVEIEFTDPQTLSIRGRAEKTYEAGTPLTAIQDKPEQAQITQSGTESPKYQRPTVEDESETSVSGVTPAATPTTEGIVAQQSEAQQQPEQPSHRYWVSERSVGEFQRTFNFPARVDQDSVKASLKNGILSILVPKAQAPVSRKINIE